MQQQGVCDVPAAAMQGWQRPLRAGHRRPGRGAGWASARGASSSSSSKVGLPAELELRTHHLQRARMHYAPRHALAMHPMHCCTHHLHRAAEPWQQPQHQHQQPPRPAGAAGHAAGNSSNSTSSSEERSSSSSSSSTDGGVPHAAAFPLPSTDWALVACLPLVHALLAMSWTYQVTRSHTHIHMHTCERGRLPLWRCLCAQQAGRVGEPACRSEAPPLARS